MVVTLEDFLFNKMLLPQASGCVWPPFLSFAREKAFQVHLHFKTCIKEHTRTALMEKNTQAGKMGWIDLFDIGHCEFLHDDGASGVQ